MGGIIGSSVSAGFLLVLGLMNGYILFKLIRQMQLLVSAGINDEARPEITGGGVLFRCFRWLFKLIDRWVKCSAHLPKTGNESHYTIKVG